MTITLIKINSKKPTTLAFLSEIMQNSIEELSQTNSHKEICSFLLLFSSQASVRERLLINKNQYFLINENKNNIGFIELQSDEKEIIIQNLHILKQYRKTEIYRKVIKNLFQSGKKIKLSMFQIFSNDLENLKKLGFESVCVDVIYLGSDIFLNKENLEIKKIL